MPQQTETSEVGKMKDKVNYASDSEDVETEDYNCCNCDLVLWAFRLLHGFSLLISLFCLCANVFAIVTYDISYRDLILRFFELVLCFIVICLELEWKYLIKKLRLLYTFSGRGLILLHIGIVTLYPKAQFIWIGASAILLGMFYVCASVCFNLQLYEFNRYHNYATITSKGRTSISV